MIYPSGRAVWLAVAGILPTFAIALLLPALWYLGLAWTCAVLGFTLIDVVAAPGRSTVTAEISSTGRVAIGSVIDLRVTINQQRAGARRVELRIGHDDRIIPLSADTATIKLPDSSVTLSFRAERRGIAAVDRLWLRWRGPFGLAWQQKTVPVGHGIAVMPDVERVREQAIALLQSDALTGDLARKRGGRGREFDSLKDYQPGMERRFIDWKRSARHGQLLAKDFQVEQNNNIVLAIDSGRLMCEPLDGMPRIDRAVTAALLMAFVALRGGDLVSLFSFDSRPRISSGATRGADRFLLLQRLAAEIDYSTEETNFTLALTTLAGKLTRRSLIVVFTDFVDPVSAELMLRVTSRLTERHVVLFMLMRDEELEGLADAVPETLDDVARAVTAGAMLRDRDLVIGRLKLLGADVIEADHKSIGAALIARYLAIKRMDRL
ncbi:MAG: DUF58 domain-containing protein [Sphingomonas sp.]|uniref:DUF58 domain-containing protein n=1 Tax=Sphingomonas sp. TaxID=28214 RepID=UPI0025D7D1E9|nr:DUF58 domain-containing protein [Sphingomonas sp.]MBY0283791.1 DUF58 domain-containing protein [Sphingomonas sp.]